MKRSKFTEEQISFALRQAETGTRVAEVCRKMGVSEATFYNLEEEVWRPWRGRGAPPGGQPGYGRGAAGMRGAGINPY